MNPWEMLLASGRPNLEDVQAEQGQQGVPGNANLWAGVPNSPQAPDPTGEPSIRGKVMKFEGHWEKVPGGRKYIRDKVWYEDAQHAALNKQAVGDE